MPRLIELLMVVVCSLLFASQAHGYDRNAPLCNEPSEFDFSRHLQGLPSCVGPTGAKAGSEWYVPRARSHTDGESSPSYKDPVPDIFVGISISGGGSRAANFGLEGLKLLSDLGILQHATAISTVSGGGLPGAYYAVHSKDMQWGHAAQLMKLDFLGKWIIKNLLPQNIIETAFTSKTRTDLMEEVFEEALFHNQTYASLGPFQNGNAPIWVANATSLDAKQNGAYAFQFTSETFAGLGSALPEFPIARAVMASATFPGVFNTVSLKQFQMANSGRSLASRYVHLIDGGPTDNLGLTTLTDIARGQQANMHGWSADKVSCFIVAIDAYPEGIVGADDYKSDLRHWYDHIVDTNFNGAFDRLLDIRRSTLLEKLGIDKFASNSFAIFETKWDVTGVYTNESYKCALWHINLQAVARSGAQAGSFDSRKLGDLVAQIKTNFRLTGPQHCSADFLQKALFVAARSLVFAESSPRDNFCRLMAEAGAIGLERCGAAMEMSSVFDGLDISKVRYLNNELSSEVECAG